MSGLSLFLAFIAGVLVISWYTTEGDQPFRTVVRRYLRGLPGRCRTCGYHTTTQGHDERCTTR